MERGGPRPAEAPAVRAGAGQGRARIEADGSRVGPLRARRRGGRVRAQVSDGASGIALHNTIHHMSSSKRALVSDGLQEMKFSTLLL